VTRAPDEDGVTLRLFADLPGDRGISSATAREVASALLVAAELAEGRHRPLT
jgi:hypothetical protein